MPVSDTARGAGLGRPLRILHLEDNPDDSRIIQGWLTQQNVVADFITVESEADFVRAMGQTPFDIVLSDNSLPGFDGSSALRFVRDRFPQTPFVFVTGSMGEEAAIETMKEGATDYVLKDRLSRLIPAVQRAIREAEREQNIRRNEEKVREQAALIDKAQDAIVVTDVEDRVLFWNGSAERIYGWSPTAAIGRKAGELLSLDQARYAEARRTVIETGSWTGELAAANRGGNELVIESRWTLLRDESGRPKSILLIDTDITEKKTLEAKFLRSQRLDSIGALAGGIAHDLNNALAPVLMSAELLRGSADPAIREKFLEIISANTQRAADLVRQILSFARGSAEKPGPIELKTLIEEMGRLVKETFPKSVTHAVRFPEEELWTVEGDPTKLHQVLLNLCVNARDAMPQGGRLTLAADNVVLDDATAASMGGKSGRYVMLSVGDTGMGIPPEVLPRIFEPFYTTKKGDKGTGLGLATVSAIVKHHAGFMDIRTRPGEGTEFRIYLPVAERAQAAGVKAPEVALPTGDGQTVLVIDDEEALLELTRTILESFGYKVITAQNGIQGIERFRENQADIKLLITDKDMPTLGGTGAIGAITELAPQLPIIITSGDAPPPGSEMPNCRTLQKPYTMEELLMLVAESLKAASPA